MTIRPLLVAMCIASAIDATARADDGAPAPCLDKNWLHDWWTGERALGGWCGFRQKLEDAGITFSGSNTENVFGNVTGGTRNTTAFAQETQANLDVTVGTLTGINRLKDTIVHVDGYWNSGNSLSDKAVHNYFTIQQVYEPHGLYIGQLYLQQTLLDDALTLQAGRLAASETFGTLDVFGNYVSAAVNGEPTTLPDNIVPYTSAPSTTWGVSAQYTPPFAEDWTFAAGIDRYNRRASELKGTAPSNWGWGAHGFGGALQVTYNINQAEGDAGLPGTYILGALVSDGPYENQGSGKRQTGNYGFYAMAQQMVYREGGPSSDEGLTPWAAVTWNPQDARNQVPVMIAAGAVYQGLLPLRPDDTTALAFYAGYFSSEIKGASVETVLEANYTYQLTPWLGLTPDLQYIIRPSGFGPSNDGHDAMTIGGQIQITF